jgi:hypothetical protein
MESGTFASHGFYFDLTVPRCLGVFSAKAWLVSISRKAGFTSQLQGVSYERPGGGFSVIL